MSHDLKKSAIKRRLVKSSWNLTMQIKRTVHTYNCCQSMPIVFTTAFIFHDIPSILQLISLKYISLKYINKIKVFKCPFLKAQHAIRYFWWSSNCRQTQTDKHPLQVRLTPCCPSPNHIWKLLVRNIVKLQRLLKHLLFPCKRNATLYYSELAGFMDKFQHDFII